LARRILLADDSVTAQNMGRRILTDAGYEVVTVNNGSAALKKIAENKPDLIVLDVYMPGYGGLEVCQRVKENPETKQIPVLLTVGKLEPFKAEEARRVGADAFIIKPFEATELLTVLTKLEDKVVAQPQPQKSGRFAKALAAVQQSDVEDRFGDKETGWKNRLTIPVPHVKPKAGEEAPDTAATSHSPENRDSEQTETVRPVETAQGFERPIPAGLPADITPEEIAAITAAAASFGSKTEQPPTIPETSVQDAVASQEVVSPVAAIPEPGDSEASAVAQAPSPEASQEVQADAPAEAVPEPVASAEAATAEDHQVQESQVQAGEIEQQPASAELPSTASNSETTSEVQISQPAPPVAGDAEVMAAIASLAPTNGHGENLDLGAYGSNGTGPEVPGSIYSSAIASEVVSGPRWIAQPVEVALEESKLALDQEMDQVHAARASAEAASLSVATAVASSSPVAVAEPVEPAIAAEASVVESKSIESTAVEASTVHDQVPVAAEASAYAAAASAGAGAEHAAPIEAVSATSIAPENNATAQAESPPRREAELAAAWQNWKQIRESFVSSQPPAVASDAPVELTSNPEETVAPVQPESADEVVEPGEVEEVASDTPEESTVIASMVDNMLAELRPKLVEEIAKKMSSEKKEKDKKKKK
jgi:twitching motility two-component system response regulator PilH